MIPMLEIRPPPRPPPFDAFACLECAARSVCDCPHRLCLTHAVAFYASLVRTGAALAVLTREVPLDVIRWVPLASLLAAKPAYWYPGPRRLCRVDGCGEPRATATGKLCVAHLRTVPRGLPARVRPCRVPDCAAPLSTRRGLYCVDHLRAARSRNGTVSHAKIRAQWTKDRES